VALIMAASLLCKNGQVELITHIGTEQLMGEVLS